MPSRSSAKVVIAEAFSQTGVDVLRGAGIDVVSTVGATAGELHAALADADGLIVRSETRVDRALLARSPRLAVVARAGVGVDAIDVPAATEAGIVVLNTPGANTLAATEHTFALMLALVRHVPDAAAAVRAGRWTRGPFTGTELHGKTLGIVGLGRIGGAVAERARAFGMRLVASDPFVSRERAAALGAELVPLAALLRACDIVTLHVPLGPQTRGMIGREQLAALRPQALLVNCARGEIVDEAALYDALEAKALRGAALDVVAEEPPPPEGTGARLHRHPRVIATPHVGGSTVEALERIATELARDVASVLSGSPAAGAVNAAVPSGPDAVVVRPFVDLAHRIGRLYPQLARDTALPPFLMTVEGRLASLDAEPLVDAFLAGLLQATTDRRISVVNARTVATELGAHVDVRRDEQTTAFAASMRVNGGATSIAGTHAYGGPRIVEIDGFAIDAVPHGAMLFTHHRDVPGMIGKVGTILGEAAINISTMQVSRRDAGGDAIMILSTDRRAEPGTVERLRAIDGVKDVRAIDI